MAVLVAEAEVAAGASGDEPGDGAPEPGGVDGAVGVGGDGLLGEVVGVAVGVDPIDEPGHVAVDPVDGAGVAGGTAPREGLLERLEGEQVPAGGEALEDGDGAGDGEAGDAPPGAEVGNQPGSA
ncbi:MAG: hypothetical protein KY463_16425 [Actinobacteria bacterium]|nr:hypothetical protein [Actinomycetota bacterium]